MAPVRRVKGKGKGVPLLAGIDHGDRDPGEQVNPAIDPTSLHAPPLVSPQVSTGFPMSFQFDQSKHYQAFSQPSSSSFNPFPVNTSTINPQFDNQQINPRFESDYLPPNVPHPTSMFYRCFMGDASKVKVSSGHFDNDASSSYSSASNSLVPPNFDSSSSSDDDDDDVATELILRRKMKASLRQKVRRRRLSETSKQNIRLKNNSRNVKRRIDQGPVSESYEQMNNAGKRKLKMLPRSESELNANRIRNIKTRANLNETDRERVRAEQRERMRVHREEVRTRGPLFMAAVLTDEGRLRVNPVPHNLGPRDKVCGHCRALHFAYEVKYRKELSTGVFGNVYSDCCDQGKINVGIYARHSEYPPELEEFFHVNGNNHASINTRNRKFFRNIDAYNNSLSMASMGYKKANINDGGGPYVFKVNGMVHHFTYNLDSLSEGELTHYNQTWLLNTNDALNARLSANANLDRVVLQSFSDYLTDHNQFFTQYKNMYELAQERNLTEYSIRFFSRPNDTLNFELPSTDQGEIVAALCDGDSTTEKGVYVHRRNESHPNATNFLSYTNEFVDPLTYPILFPNLQLGWHPKLSKDPTDPESRCVTLMEHCSYLFSERVGVFNPVLHSRKLSQQFAVDSGCKIIVNRLDYFSQKQKFIRADQLMGVEEFLEGLAEENYALSQEMAQLFANGSARAQGAAGNVGANDIGILKKLPSSFRGGPRYNRKNYFNSVSLVSYLGKPCLLLTMTCNPNWPEIVELLVDGETSNDRFDLVCKVFEGKVKALMEYIDKNGIFGKCEAITGVTEFQKRGLPHAHILIWLDRAHKLRTPADIDRVVCAEIPDEAENPQLYALVKKFMIHRKCGPDTPNAACMKRKKMRKQMRARTNVVNGGQRERVLRDAADEEVGDLLNESDELFQVEGEELIMNNDFDYDETIEQEDVGEVNVDPAMRRLSRDFGRLSTDDREGVAGPSRPHLPEQSASRDKCGMGFPKDFTDFTDLSAMYPRYRRPNNGRKIVFVKRGREEEYDNQWVVPYNPFLLLLFNCHINLEVVSSSTLACKYLFGYIHKGDDMANIQISKNEQGRDEIKAYATTKCITPMEAIYHIFSLKTYFMTHGVTILDIHLPGQQLIFWGYGQVEQAMQRGRSLWTTLTAWFELNKWCALIHDDQDRVARQEFRHTFQFENARGERKVIAVNLPVDSRNFFYYEIPKYFTFHKVSGGPHYWDVRKANFRVFGRIFHVNPLSADPNERERYCERLLLLNVKGATSFEDLRTDLQGNVCDSFKEACIRRGLLESDQGHEMCLTEAAHCYRSYHLRHLFILILSTNSVTDPVALFDKFKGEMYNDYVYNTDITPEAAEIRLYLELEKIGLDFGIELASYLPRPVNCPASIGELDHEQNAQELAESGLERYSRLRGVQLDACDFILMNIRKAQSDPTKERLFFLNGMAGAGKTFIYHTIHDIATGVDGLKVLCVAYSGIAAFLLPNGRTAHSAFRLKFNMSSDDYTSTLRAQDRYADELRKVDVIVWDEIVMVPRWGLEGVNVLLKDLMGNDLPFGGKTLIVGGDFRQILPIIKKGVRKVVFDSCVLRHELWFRFHMFTLTVNHRSSNPLWQAYVLRLGDGNEGVDDPSGEEMGKKTVVIDPSLLVGSLQALIDFVFDDETLGDPKKLASAVILCARNADANLVNELVCEKLLDYMQRNGRNASMAKLLSEDRLAPDSEIREEFFCTEFLNRENPAGFPPHELNLTIGAIVSLVRNLSVKKGLNNGTRMIVEECNQHILKCRMLTSIDDNAPLSDRDVVLIPRIPLIVDAEQTDIGVTFIRTQFPVRLSFGMSINKSQGQTLHRVGLYLEHPVFSHGQLYVAMSRVRDPENLRVYCGWGKNVTTNVVWKEAIFGSARSAESN